MIDIIGIHDCVYDIYLRCVCSICYVAVSIRAQLETIFKD